MLGHLCCRPRTSIVTGSQLQLDLLTAKLKKLEEEQAESEAQRSSESETAGQQETVAGSILNSSSCRSPFEPESRRRLVGFEVEADLQVDASSRQGQACEDISQQAPQVQQHRGKPSAFTGSEAGPRLEVLAINRSTGKKERQDLSLRKSRPEPERLPGATAEKDGSFVLKGLDRFKNAGGHSRWPKLESFDRRIGRQPNAIKEVS